MAWRVTEAHTGASHLRPEQRTLFLPNLEGSPT
jgi:hypothetical protein